MNNKDYGLGKCQEPTCNKFAIVGMNGVFLCIKHFDDALDIKFKPVRDLVQSLREKEKRGER